MPANTGILYPEKFKIDIKKLDILTSIFLIHDNFFLTVSMEDPINLYDFLYFDLVNVTSCRYG